MGRKVCVVAKIGTRPRAASARVTSRTMRGRLVADDARAPRRAPQVCEDARVARRQGAARHDDSRPRACRRVELAHGGEDVPAHEGTRGESSVHAVRAESHGFPVVLPGEQVGGDRQVLGPRALVEDREHGLGEVAAVDAVPGAGEGDGERVRRAPHVEDLLALFEREQIQEPALVITGCVACERRGPLVPIGLRVAVDCARLFSVRGWHHAMPSLSYREAWQHRLANVRIVLQF